MPTDIRLPPRLRVLLAIPSKDLASTVVAMLRGLGVERQVRKAHDSADALRLLATESFDAMIVDGALVPEDGVATTRRLRSAEGGSNREIPVIMISAATGRKRIEMARDAGISEFVRLPVSTEVVGLRLQSALSAPRAFVSAPGYVGPDRRRRRLDAPGTDRRRGAALKHGRATT